MKPFSKIEFCNYKGISYLEITALTPTGAITVRRELEDYMLNDGVLQNVEDMAKSIKAEMNIEKMPPFELILHTTGQFKTIVSLPTMSPSQACSLYYKEAREHGKFEKYVSTYNMYKHSLGYIFSTYYMSEPVVKSLKILAKLLGSRVTTVTPYGFYLHKALNTKESFVYFHIRNKVCNMLLISEGELISTYDFTFEDRADVERQFLLVMSKHEFEFEHREITHYVIDSDSDMTLELGLDPLSLDDITLPEPIVSEEQAERKPSLIASLLAKFKRKNIDAPAPVESIEAAPVPESVAQIQTPTNLQSPTFADQLAKELTEHLESTPDYTEEQVAPVPALVAVAEREAQEPVAPAFEETAEDTALDYAPTEEPIAVPTAEEETCDVPTEEPTEEPTTEQEPSTEPDAPVSEPRTSEPQQKPSLITLFKSALTRKAKSLRATIIRARADVELPTIEVDGIDTVTGEELEAKRRSLIELTEEVIDNSAPIVDDFRHRFKNAPEWVKIDFAQRAREILSGEGMSYIVEEQATVFLYHGSYHSHVDIRDNKILYFTEE